MKTAELQLGNGLLPEASYRQGYPDIHNYKERVSWCSQFLCLVFGYILLQYIFSWQRRELENILPDPLFGFFKMFFFFFSVSFFFFFFNLNNLYPEFFAVSEFSSWNLNRWTWLWILNFWWKQGSRLFQLWILEVKSIYSPLDNSSVQPHFTEPRDELKSTFRIM